MKSLYVVSIIVGIILAATAAGVLYWLNARAYRPAILSCDLVHGSQTIDRISERLVLRNVSKYDITRIEFSLYDESPQSKVGGGRLLDLDWAVRSNTTAEMTRTIDLGATANIYASTSCALLRVYFSDGSSWDRPYSGPGLL
jgi:hypothetical protein